MSVPKSRLNEIARRKLGSLGIATHLAADGETLEGELPAGLRSPVGGKGLGPLRFEVVGHDRLRVLEPALLEGLPPVPFYDAHRPEPIFAELELLLQRRLEAAQDAVARLGAMNVAAELDRARLRAVAKVEIVPIGYAVLEGDERGLRAAWAVAAASARPPAPLGDVKVELAEFSHRVDLELWLFPLVEEALKRAPAPAPRRAPAPPPASGLTLGALSEKFGAGARLEPGSTVARELVLGGEPLRFAARLEPSGGFAGKLVSAAGTIWEGSFELAAFAGVEELVASIAGGEEPGRRPSQAAPPPPPAAGTGAWSLGADASAPRAAPPEDGGLDGHILPVAGEVWVMSMLVEADDGREVRYVPVDVDGRRVGGTRTLPRRDFLATFEQAGAAGYRLPVRVLVAEGDSVRYVQLDPRREIVGRPKSSAVQTFVQHFVPEAAAY